MSWNAGSFQTLGFPGRRSGLKMLPIGATIKVLVASAAGDFYLQSDVSRKLRSLLLPCNPRMASLREEPSFDVDFWWLFLSWLKRNR